MTDADVDGESHPNAAADVLLPADAGSSSSAGTSTSLSLRCIKVTRRRQVRAVYLKDEVRASGVCGGPGHRPTHELRNPVATVRSITGARPDRSSFAGARQSTSVQLNQPSPGSLSTGAILEAGGGSPVPSCPMSVDAQPAGRDPADKVATRTGHRPPDRSWTTASRLPRWDRISLR